MLEFGKVAGLSHKTMKDGGIFLVTCTPNQHQMVWAMAGAVGWTQDQLSTTFCKVPIYKDADMTKRCLLISVWKKLYAPIDVAIPKPKDAWFDPHVQEEWTMKDGQPLRSTKNITMQKL